jgi:hypothetical protein
VTVRFHNADYPGADVRWTTSGNHAICRIGLKAWQIRKRRADGSPFGDLLDVVATLKRASEWFAEHGVTP